MANSKKVLKGVTRINNSLLKKKSRLEKIISHHARTEGSMKLHIIHGRLSNRLEVVILDLELLKEAKLEIKMQNKGIQSNKVNQKQPETKQMTLQDKTGPQPTRFQKLPAKRHEEVRTT